MHFENTSLKYCLLTSVPLLFSAALFPLLLSAEPELALEFISSRNIGHSSIGLSEPSGLTVSANTGDIWIVSDDTAAVFKLAPAESAFIDSQPIAEDEMESITLAESSNSFFTVNEAKGRLTQFATDDGRRLNRNKISAMAGYTDIRPYIKASGKKSGFEGLAWHPVRHTLLAVLEGPPGLLVEISGDLNEILNATLLSTDVGFIDPDDDDATIDFSGLSYDARHDRLWLLSDEAARVFLYDLIAERVTQSLPLQRLNKKGKARPINKPEGIGLSPDGKVLYVVSDSDARLYLWRIVRKPPG